MSNEDDDDWEKMFDEFKMDLDDKKKYKEQFKKWFWKTKWVDHDEV